MTQTVIPLCICGHMKRHHTYHALTGRYRGACRRDCSCVEYRSPDCVCGHRAVDHAGAMLECWHFEGASVCPCQKYHAHGGVMMPPMQERRQSERFVVTTLRFADIAGVRARLVEVSATGLGLEHDAEIAIGTLLDVVLADRLGLTLRAALIHTEFRRRAHGLGVFRSGAQLVTGVPLLDCADLAR
jgi:hypothetical protein